MPSARLILDPPAAGAWNMAVDEVLLESSPQECCFRFYTWEEPTLSLGYFQRFEDRRQHAASEPCPLVRRATGGGAILHDRELTYSVVVPAGHPLAAHHQTLYSAVHQVLLEVLAEFGVIASLHEGEESRPGQPQPFLCFQRRAKGDVVVGPVKVAGSAQRRSHEAVLQHGSVLFCRSSRAPELAGLEDFSPVPIEVSLFRERWLGRLAQRLQWSWERTPLTDAERRAAGELTAKKYGHDDWNRWRGRPSTEFF
jgi:lipoate-protein ligase A